MKASIMEENGVVKSDQLSSTMEQLVSGVRTAEGGGGERRIINMDDILAPDCCTPLSSVSVLEDVPDGGEAYSSGSMGGGDDNNKGKQLPLLSRRLEETEITALSGALAGFISGIIVCPLDVAKTRLQAQGLLSNSRYYSGILGTLSRIVKDESYRGLYKGLVPIVLGYFPTWMIYFSIYERCKKRYPAVFMNDFMANSASALTAGAITTALTNPIWVVKTRLMIQSNKKYFSVYYNGTLDAFRKMYRLEGLKVFYSGLVPSLFGLFHVAIHFPVYEQLKCWLHYNAPTTGDLDQLGHNLHLGRLIVASCISKMVASTITYPHEILRTRMQIRATGLHSGVLSMISKLYVNEGFIGFYSGFTTNIARTLPTSAVTLVSFEYFRKYIRLWNNTLQS
ncbi:NAD+ transporter Ecym_4494 [Eremothecium cymbalariae DBVPG|uniref:Mitochondrial nicotinamide adenine dinucleotide transporter 1 n=1 Tax=Eremothecium cymbalariae (strain CBS 270.75 / DBVPG 7215 / KCTC 17166 / NRRL Y-17582) TaxID=931890 RepID=G8JU30_ERECY|nr:hypothetical protein Ecym_4494 [Eremothecium cymbalariae DBVPG\